MNELHRDPPRWLESGALSEELARELAAYGAQAPAAASKARMLQQLTQQAAVPATSSVTLLKLKLFIASAVILAGAVGVLQFMRPKPAVMESVDAVYSAAPRLAPLAAERLATATEVEVEVEHPAPPVVRARRLMTRKTAAAPRPEPALVAPPVQGATPDVIAELTMLARARRALLNDPERALELSEEHARNYPRGTFDEEREVLAIESLIKLGRKDEAGARVRAFQARFPRSAQIAHLAKLIAKPSE